MYQEYKENQMAAKENAEERDPLGLTDDEVADACKEPEEATKVCTHISYHVKCFVVVKD